MRSSLQLLLLLALLPSTLAAESICYGSTANGSLEGACQLPAEGPNFSGYSDVGRLMGRTYVHCKVRDVMMAAYRDLENQAPELRFVYGETGFENGGKFSPHRTHQNGLSVDFMVPVRNSSGAAVPLPTNVLNKWGYGVEFNSSGRYGELIIDFEAIARHLSALDRAARAHGIRLAKVIFDPKLQPLLRKAPSWRGLEGRIPLSASASWIRHDEHYHVDFAVTCRSRKHGK